MNELIFLAHIFVLIAALLIALHIGIHALIGLICVQTVLMNLFVIKTITLFGLTVTATDAYAVSIMLGLNVIQEYFGRAMAQRAIWISFFTALASIILGNIQLLYLPALGDTTHAHFVEILSFMPRIVIASLLTYLVVMYGDSLFYGWLKKRFEGKYLVARNYLSISASQLLDTVLFSFLGLYGIVPSVVPIIVVSYAVKMVVILLGTPFMALTKQLVAKK
jgi:uncharacterized integral membrane protein (TIGR00697 family)